MKKWFLIGILCYPYWIFSQQIKQNNNVPMANTKTQEQQVINTPIQTVTKPIAKVQVQNTTISSTNSKAQNTENPPKEEENTGALNTYFTQGNIDDTTTNTQAPEIPSAWGPFFFLTFLIVGIYLVIRWVKKKMQTLKIENNPVDFIKTVATIPIVGNAQIAIIDMGGRFYLFGITTHSMDLITEITDLDLIMKIQTIPARGNPKSFKEIIAEIFGSRSTKKISSPESEDQIKQFIENQKNRIGKMK